MPGSGGSGRLSWPAVPWPAAEVQLDEGLVRELLAAQHADLAAGTLRLVAAGFDNELWRLGDDLAVRMPRRAAAAALLENEQRWLPDLAPGLPLAVPAPVRIGRPSGRYPWPWSVVPWLPGDPGDRASVADAADAGNRLGRFLAALHRPAPRSAPFNPWRSVSLSGRADMFRARLPILRTEDERRRLRRVWHLATQAGAHPGPPLWIHGDLHPANVLVAGGTLAGVIDFGDLCAGDPATDVAAVWLLLPRDGVDAFAAAYGSFTPAVRQRSLGWAALFALMLLELGSHDRPTYGRMGRAGLDRILSEISLPTPG
jgi:aminoglycoside phosphotransferase (APT) family kinase protein